MEQPSWIPLRLRESNSNPAGSAVLVLAVLGYGFRPAATSTADTSATAASSTANTATLPVPLLPAQKSKII